MWGKGNTSALLMGMKTGTATLDISMAISQKIRKNLPQDPAIPLLGIYPKDAQSCHKGHVLSYVHSSIVCLSQNLESS